VARHDVQSKMETFFKLELEGPIFPQTMQSLCNIFTQTQKQFSFTTKPDERCLGMNFDVSQLKEKCVKRGEWNKVEYNLQLQ
jgi:hypothetical protein